MEHQWDETSAMKHQPSKTFENVSRREQAAAKIRNDDGFLSAGVARTRTRYDRNKPGARQDAMTRRKPRRREIDSQFLRGSLRDFAFPRSRAGQTIDRRET
jgi:hypothetical protein